MPDWFIKVKALSETPTPKQVVKLGGEFNGLFCKQLPNAMSPQDNLINLTSKFLDGGWKGIMTHDSSKLDIHAYHILQKRLLRRAQERPTNADSTHLCPSAMSLATLGYEEGKGRKNEKVNFAEGEELC